MQREPMSHDTQEMRVQGNYEPIPTDTGFLAAELAQRSDLTGLSRNFDEGLTPLRDVGEMLTAQRQIILEARRTGSTASLYKDHPRVFTDPVRALHSRVTEGAQDQPIGHNFWVNATGFIDAGYPWATDFDVAVRTRTGLDVRGIVQSGDYGSKDALLRALTDRPDGDMTQILATYLAGRSLAGEQYLDRQYGAVLERTKGEVFSKMQEIAVTTGLRPDMIERIAAHIYRTRFGSFDHLAGLVTSDNSGAAGDYRIGSLRIEVQFDGSVRQARLRTPEDALRVIAHEVAHASSAQFESRCGLQMHGQGLQANEGMTEYLAQLATGSPGILTAANGNSRVARNVPYSGAVLAMHSLHRQFLAGRNQHFATLFNAYHGDVRDTARLEAAFDAFYVLNKAISG